jgi:hypothetical protein
MKSLNLFAQIAKIDESKHEVWGVATAEVVDKEGEIFDYQSSKPYFKNWSDEIAKATDGKSLGNVREMHEPSAVGKLVAIAFDDDLKQIRVGARIVDGVAWQKCMLGVYTGFSIGGAYVKAWKDGEYVRFTASPVEISVVDNPCVPGAHFTAVKADGTCEVRKFSQEASTDQAFKIGARHSKATRAHLDALPNQGNNDDVTLQSLISNASLQVLQYIERPHILSSVLGPLTENYDGNDSDRLLPRNFPIISVSSVSIDGVSIQAATTPTTAGYLWDGRRILLRGFRFCRGVQNVQLSYSAGYPSVPLDLKQAAIEAFALTYRQRVRIGEKSNSMSGQVTIAFDMSDVPPRSLAVFSQYRRLAL